MTVRVPIDAPRVLAVAVLTALIGSQALRNAFGWWGFGAVVLVLLIAAVAALVARRPWPRWSRTPKSVLAFVAFAGVSLIWSAYPGASAIGIVAQLATTVGAAFVGLCLSRADLVTALGRSLRIVVGLSLLFELIVAVLVRRPVLPAFIDLPSGRIPDAFYWSQAALFTGEPIQGLVGNRNLLGLVALLGLVVVLVEIASRSLPRRAGAGWAVVFAATLLLTRSSTVLLCLVAVALAAGAALWARRLGEERRRPVYLTSVLLGAGLLAAGILARGPILAFLGKSEDATGRLDIWEAVTALALERPVLGWGWVSYWAPWAAPFDTLAERNGVLYLQAHDAWLDVWFQLGIVGLVLFAAIAASVLWRSWFRAVDRPRRTATGVLPYTATSLAPLLITVVLLAHSVAESRILIESGWLLLAALAFSTKATDRDDIAPLSPAPAPPRADSVRGRGPAARALAPKR